MRAGHAAAHATRSIVSVSKTKRDQWLPFHQLHSLSCAGCDSPANIYEAFHQPMCGGSPLFHTLMSGSSLILTMTPGLCTGRHRTWLLYSWFPPTCPISRFIDSLFVVLIITLLHSMSTTIC